MLRVNRAPVLTMKFEQVGHIGGHDAGDHKPREAGPEQMEAGIPEGAFFVLQEDALLDYHGGDDQAC